MQEISRKTLELILKNFEAVSKDETRPQLNAVRLGKDKDDNLIVESCDGHILSRHFISEPELTLDKDILIHRDSKAKLKTFLTTNKSYVKFLIDTNVEDNRNLRIFTLDSRDGAIMEVVFREYPKTDAVIPKVKREEYMEIAFNPTLLTKLYKSMNGEKRNPKVKLLVKKDNPLAPIMVESGNDNLGVLMPLKI